MILEEYYFVEAPPFRHLHVKSRGRKRAEEEILALYSGKAGTGEGESNMLRTFEKSSPDFSCSACTIWAFSSLFVAVVES